ncbi:hypothetical protein pEaSNUABM28_00292 [Erwinia phage pEa_SNUABM_28]|uniref:Uncharacterized protein n=2 Tax=Alexandravirus TaxID=2733088 RepID=A0AAE8XRM7_9CAUD|nr:hypothetical protein MPK63_gp291 [Erwinia phage pEa_SNUABM_22]YP_010300051.1 hypothetical protein MPK64_gp290 [Erwinia phage pEa_SNUABM_16]QZE58849.1 hypothetical protein pEaSNUABM28_00292 [Erwinia phage pEa_SNUABM_28]QZE59193.1 hypothetical protein pEaSNUABM18_00290 [Erwinia phage pEa_SNUABM_18]UAW96434.1 hypothetical protein pEaSNUABM16_00290 [Erwinia phage pEa_SNUABM_16]UAW96779.1 hypothetical protein pEaSNUABM22_00292 [Erwinia phage pEa_SNUABM_22]
MKTLLSAVKIYWREAMILAVLVVIAVALPFLEVRNPVLVMLVAVIVAAYFIATWACKPVYGSDDEKE